jgi:hypothetical protein
VAEVAVHGVGRDEEALSDLSISQPFGDEARDGEFRRRQRRPTVRLGFGGDKAPPYAEFAEATADAAGVPGRAEFCVEGAVRGRRWPGDDVVGADGDGRFLDAEATRESDRRSFVAFEGGRALPARCRAGMVQIKPSKTAICRSLLVQLNPLRGQRVLPDCCPRLRAASLLRQRNMPVSRHLPMTGATGLEPATSGVTGRRSNQLNYAPGTRDSLASAGQR